MNSLNSLRVMSSLLAVRMCNSPSIHPFTGGHCQVQTDPGAESDSYQRGHRVLPGGGPQRQGQADPPAQGAERQG